ncbi:MAG: BrnT family toxin [Candidatus Shapirobacteria bacterium]
MRLIPEPIIFDWDSGNNDKNFLKHQVSMQEAEEVFGNEPLIIVKDIYHSQKELRYQGMGKTNSNRLLFVSFTIRTGQIRIISIRNMSKKEKNKYEKI